MMNRKIALVFVLTSALFTTGCAFNEGNKAFMKAVNSLSDLPKTMKNAHLYAFVLEDEVFGRNYGRYALANLYMAGATPKSSVLKYRVIVLRMRNHDTPGLLWTYAALVPDSLPPLKAYDVVELRHLDTYDSVGEFEKSGEAAVVTRAFCLVGQPNYQECVRSLPTKTTIIGTKAYFARQTDAPFKPSLKDYGLGFSPRYDTATGEVLATASALPARPWPAPTKWEEGLGGFENKSFFSAQ